MPRQAGPCRSCRTLEPMRPPRPATPRTAALSGAALVVGMAALDYAKSALVLSSAAEAFLFAASLGLLFFVPVMLFVVGPQYFGYRARDAVTLSYWLSLRGVLFRGMWWLLGAGAAAALLSAIQVAIGLLVAK
jgi:hypothetical protein